MILLRFEIFSWTLRFLVSSKENILRIIFLMILWPTCIHLFLLLIREIQNSSLGWHSFSEINHPVKSKTLVLTIYSRKMTSLNESFEQNIRTIYLRKFCYFNRWYFQRVLASRCLTHWQLILSFFLPKRQKCWRN